MNGLENLAEVLENMTNEIHVDPAIGAQAVRAIDRMLDFAAAKKANLTQASAHFNGIGPA